MWVQQHRRTIFSILVSSFMFAAATAGDPSPLVRTLESGRVRVELRPYGRGMSIYCAGIAVSNGSNMVVTKPPWAPHYYLGPDEKCVRDAVIQSQTGGAADNPLTVTLAHRGSDGAFTGTESISLSADGVVEQAVEGVFNLDEGEALVQWQIAALNPTLIVGRPFKASKRDGKEIVGTVPVTALAGDVDSTTLASNIRWIEFDSRIGPLRIECTTDRKLVCYDHRKNKWADPGNPLFWFGDLGSKFKKGDVLSYKIRFVLPPAAAASVRSERADAAISTAALDRAQTWPLDQTPVITPRPKSAAFSGELFLIPPAAIRGDGETVANRLVPDVAVVGDVERRVYEAFCAEALTLLGGMQPGPRDSWLRFADLDDAKIVDAYRVRVTPTGVEISFRPDSASGLRYAMQTLLQLAVLTPDGRLALRCAEIADYPSLSFRGVHMFTGGKGPELHLKLIRAILAALKMNHIILEAEYVHWDAFPELRHPEYGMPKSDVRAILHAARRLGVEVSPLINSLGHSQWIFTNNEHLDLAEDPDAKWAYCVTNPATYDFIFQIHSEVVELFWPPGEMGAALENWSSGDAGVSAATLPASVAQRAARSGGASSSPAVPGAGPGARVSQRWFHIGHDEFHHRGKVPGRESSKPYSVEQLFTMDTLRHRDWLTERGIRMLMWGDMLLAPGEAVDATSVPDKSAAARMRAQIPDDVLITDWHYAANPWRDLTRSLDILRKDGHDVIACSWSRPPNITGLAKAAYESGALGLLQTTWAGYSLDPQRFAAEMQQYAAYVLAAEAAWNAENPPDPTGYLWYEKFLRLMELSSFRYQNRGGWTANLKSAANAMVGASDAVQSPQNRNGEALVRDWFGLGAAHSLTNLPRGAVALDGLRFQIVEGERPVSVALAGGLARSYGLPTEVRLVLAVNGRATTTARTLAFLHVTNFNAEPKTRIAEYVVEFVDGTSASIPVVYGETIFAYNDLSAAAQAPVVWSGTTPAGDPVAVRVLLWDNPTPEKSITAVTARSAGAPASLLLLGLTGLDVPASQ